MEKKLLKLTRILPLLFIFFAASFAGAAYAGNLKVHFINAGDGDAVLIEAPGEGNVMIDAGNLISGWNVVEYLNKNKIKALDYLIFTHPHPDHTGGAFFIMPIFKVNRVSDNGAQASKAYPSEDIYRWYEQLIRRTPVYSVLKSGSKFSVGDVTFDVLWPLEQQLPGDFNANSLVIMLSYKKFKCLFAGDLNAIGEGELLKITRDLKSSCLKVAHHGASDSSTRDFIKAVSPAVSVISVNKDNAYGSPSEDVISDFMEAGARVYRTDRDGNITVTIKKDGNFSVETQM